MRGESYRFKLGTFECIVVNDGTFAYPHPAQIFFANAAKERLEEVLSDHDLNLAQWEQYISPYLSLVIHTEQHIVLVDTGAGSLVPTTGKLMTNLKAERISPEDVDTVILTHGHPDHIGGNIDEESNPAFPNARYVVWKEEWDFWTSEPDLSPLKIDEQIKQVILESSRKNLPPIQNQLDLIKQEKDIVPGIRAIAAPGHTPGHMALAVSSGDEKLLCISDTAIHPINLEQPGWYAAVDLSPEQVATTKNSLFGRAAAEKTLVHAFHFPFPGLGYIIQKGDAWEWQPIEQED
ncbi:MAG: MBL fold metallo-hydrolase [Desulfobacteraceae bacterium]|jgi:glyoxylase-like metal-dependent hydrolase (beta-lactamase superfamily II)